jgi:hypothetical protein
VDFFGVDKEGVDKEGVDKEGVKFRFFVWGDGLWARFRDWISRIKLCFMAVIMGVGVGVLDSQRKFISWLVG